MSIFVDWWGMIDCGRIVRDMVPIARVERIDGFIVDEVDEVDEVEVGYIMSEMVWTWLTLFELIETIEFRFRHHCRVSCVFVIVTTRTRTHCHICR